MDINEVIKICENDIEIPIEYRTNQNKCLKLLKYIKNNNININNKDIFVLASWVNFEIERYIPYDDFSEVEKIKYGGLTKTYDLHIKNGNSYVANGIICHNTVNLPENASKDEVAKIYQTAWEEKCKGITVYRKGCRAGVLIDDKEKIKKNHSPKRPKFLPCNIHHTTVKGELYFVIVGLLNGIEPYEVFAGKSNEISKNLNDVCIGKIKRGNYSIYDKGHNIIYEDISKYIGEEQEALTRMISMALRHGAEIDFIVHQLEKTKGDLLGFSKAISRVLKKYIKEGNIVIGENCPECGGNLTRSEGCLTCLGCGFSKCS